ncbi:MAG: rod-binding protein [Candidatus Eremiobacteraeota bacterium]|nr:rod-binding protein [Candidatus Eremiobacteraeota bacterium]
MSDISKVAAPASPQDAASVVAAQDARARQPVGRERLSTEQQKALDRLHQAATQLEGVFLNMLFSEMRKTVPQDSIFGKSSQTEDVFQGMLDQQRADAMAKSGSFGIATVLENQLRQSVLSDSKRESQTQLPGAIEP